VVQHRILCRNSYSRTNLPRRHCWVDLSGETGCGRTAGAIASVLVASWLISVARSIRCASRDTPVQCFTAAARVARTISSLRLLPGRSLRCRALHDEAASTVLVALFLRLPCWSWDVVNTGGKGGIRAGVDLPHRGLVGDPNRLVFMAALHGRPGQSFGSGLNDVFTLHVGVISPGNVTA